jgi:putative oxidoreductase
MERQADTGLFFELNAGTGRRQLILLALRVIVAAVFIYAALQKIGRPLMFADEIEMYRVLDHGPLLYLAAIILPWVELLCGFALLTGIFMRGSALILSAMNLVFIIVIAYRTAGIMSSEGTPLREVFFDCGCGFGPTYAWKKLIEDAVLLGFSVLILFSPGYRFVIGKNRG